MTFALGTKSVSFCTHVDPALMRIAHLAITRSLVDFGVTDEQSLTHDAQALRDRMRFNEPDDPWHVIQADGWSKALELMPWIDGQYHWGDEQWRVTDSDDVILLPFHDIALAMQSAAIERETQIIWGAVPDRRLNSLAQSWDGLRGEIESYRGRCKAKAVRPTMTRMRFLLPIDPPA